MEQLIKKIQKLREWEHLGLITTTGNTSDKGLNEFLLELENEALRLFAVMPSCEGNCGMNYCDDNGCIDRKRVLANNTKYENSKRDCTMGNR